MQLAEVYRRLEAGPYRLTPQRHALLRTLAAHGNTALSAEELQRQVAADHHIRVGLATVYRTLDLFQLLEIIVRAPARDGESPTTARFVWARAESEGQARRVCVRCGEVGVIDPLWIQAVWERLREEDGFEALDQDVKVYGVCHPCQARGAALVMSPEEEGAG